MDFEAHFQAALDGLKERGNYRVFAELQRHQGDYPHATRYLEDGRTQDVTVWCSNDYLAMGVPYVWILDPETRQAFTATAAEGLREVKSGTLLTSSPVIAMPFANVF